MLHCVLCIKSSVVISSLYYEYISSYKARQREKQYISLYAILQRLILHAFNYTAVTYGCFSLRSLDKNQCPQNELAIPMMYKFLQKGKG